MALVPCSFCGANLSRSPSRLRARAFFCDRRCSGRFYSANGFGHRVDKASHVARYRTVQRNGKTTAEHRLVVEQALGRLLLPNEIVHHLNGDTLDNRIENLRVMDSAAHMREHLTLPISRETIEALGRDGLSHRQIAKQLGCGRSTITRRLAS